MIYQGSPQVVSPDPEANYWDKIRCPKSSKMAGDKTACLTVRRIQESSEHIYISIQRSTSPCAAKGRRWVPWPSYEGICFARVANKDLQTIVFEQPNR